MKAKQVLPIFVALTSSLAFAQNIVDASVEDKVYKAGESVALKIKLDENPRGCGMTVNFGDGSSEVKHRVKSGVVTSLAKTYSKDGEYLVSINGKAIFAGLKSVGACNGQQTVKVVVNSSYLEEQERKRNQVALEAAAASAAAEKAAAEREAQAKRIAELEAKLKAAEAQASKTPEQIAEEARIAAEAKAYAEAKVAAEMKAAARERALAEARAAAEAKAAEEARVAAEAKAAERARAAAEARAQAQKKAAEERRAQAKRVAEKYPFYAVLSCGMGNGNINLMACFAGGRGADTEIVLQQGAVQRSYKVYQIANNQIGRMFRDGLYIDLERRFVLRAQNASRSLILTLKIFDRRTNKLVLQKEAGRRFGVVSARN